MSRRCYAEARKPENRGYADNGDAVLKQAAAKYMREVCGVPIDAETQVVHSIGSKAALSILPAALINPGDVVLMTVPGYPVFGTHAKYYGGVVHNLPLREENAFLPDLKSIPADVLAKAKVLVLNYPNNPTGASATQEFFTEVVAFAKKHNIVVIHDFAYAALVFDGMPLSFLATPGAMDVGIELHSTSKNFNMTGWRCGFVAGNELLVKAYGDVKDNTDSGQFLAIQHASAYAFDHPEITTGIARSIRAGWTSWSRRPEDLGLQGEASRAARSSFTSPRRRARGRKPMAPVNRFRHGRGLQPVDDHRKSHLHRAVGRRGRLRPLQCDFRGHDHGRGNARRGRNRAPSRPLYIRVVKRRASRLDSFSRGQKLTTTIGMYIISATFRSRRRLCPRERTAGAGRFAGAAGRAPGRHARSRTSSSRA